MLAVVVLCDEDEQGSGALVVAVEVLEGLLEEARADGAEPGRVEQVGEVVTCISTGTSTGTTTGSTTGSGITGVINTCIHQLDQRSNGIGILGAQVLSYTLGNVAILLHNGRSTILVTSQAPGLVSGLSLIWQCLWQGIAKCITKCIARGIPQ